MSEKLWNNKNALSNNQKKAQEYIDYLAKKLDTPEKIASFLDIYIKYSHDEKTSDKYYD
jgi:hypothetical protein